MADSSALSTSAYTIYAFAFLVSTTVQSRLLFIQLTAVVSMGVSTFVTVFLATAMLAPPTPVAGVLPVCW